MEKEMEKESESPANEKNTINTEKQITQLNNQLNTEKQTSINQIAQLPKMIYQHQRFLYLF